MERIYLIDGSSYIYRAFHAIRDLKTSHGVPTNAVYGFTTMLMKILREHQPRYLAVILDARGPTFRHLAYEHYKANRPAMPEGLRPQIPHIKEIVRAFNVPLFEREGFEADDLMGTLAHTWAPQGFEVVLVSGDKDLLQLLSPRIRMVDTMHDRIFDVEKVRERFGVVPEQLPDIFGLMGDSSDNIPGVPGIGEKRAKDLIQRFHCLEEALSRASEVPQKKIREALLQHAEQARLSKRLATIDTAVPLDMDLEDLRVKEPHRERIRTLFKELEFHRLLQEWTEPEPGSHGTCWLVRTRAELEPLCALLGEAEQAAISAEGTRGGDGSQTLSGLALAVGPEKTAYVMLEGFASAETAKRQAAPALLGMLRPFLEGEKPLKLGHDLKSAIALLRGAGIRLDGLGGDTMVASYVLNPSRRSHGLGDLAVEFLDRSLEDGSRSIGNEGEGPDEGGRSACAAAAAVWALAPILLPRIEEEGLGSLFHEIEMPLIPVLARMEMHGIRVDGERLGGISAELEKTIAGLEQEIHELAGEPFNINSPQQLGGILFERLKLPVVKKTKTGYSTDMDVLQELSKNHPLPAKVVEFRSLVKLKSTYVDALPALIRPETGRVHTSFNQTVTATGRLSSSEPNLQNIPVRSEVGQRIRAAFVTEEGWRFLSADYSQVELRVLAHLSKDPILTESFHRGEDIHRRTAAEIFGVSPESVTPEMRREAKVINFGIVYGMTAFGLSRELNVEPRVAQAYIEGYFQRYRGVRDFLDGILEEARARGYVETMMGRRRYLPEIKSPNTASRKFAERMAINTPIQGTAADMIKRAMIRIQERLDQESLSARMLLQVHDELLLEVPEREREAVAKLVKGEMEGVERLDVPIVVELGWGSNWAEAH